MVCCSKNRCRNGCGGHDDCCFNWSCCCWRFRARALWYPIIALGFFLMFIILYYAGYKGNNSWNANSVETTCRILNNYAISSGYGNYISCDCVEICPTPTTCHEKCGSCFVPFYLGFTNLTYVNHTLAIEIITLDDNQASPTAVVQQLNKTYPPNSTMPCYYQKNNVQDFKLELDPVTGYWVSADVFLGICCAGLFSWFVYEIVRLIKKKCKARNVPIVPTETSSLINKPNEILKEECIVPIEKAVESDKKCPVCLTNKGNYIITKCGHLGYCRECLYKLNKCPVCQENYVARNDVIKSYAIN